MISSRLPLETALAVRTHCPYCAYQCGVLLTDVRVDLVHTDVQREDRLNLVQIAEELHELEERTRARLAKEGIRSLAIHGDLRQVNREKALTDFSSGKLPVLVATDVAARGLHIEAVDVVIHFDPPADAKDYVHRSGRTARAGASGVVVSLVTPDKSGAVKKLQRDLGVPTLTGAPDLNSLAVVLGEGSVESVRKNILRNRMKCRVPMPAWLR